MLSTLRFSYDLNVCDYNTNNNIKLLITSMQQQFPILYLVREI